MKNLSFVLCSILAFSVLGIWSCDDDCSCAPVARTLTLQPNSAEGKDVGMNNQQTNTNFGDFEEITALAWTCGGDPCTIRSLIEFDLSEIPSSATIKEAELSLFAFDSPSNGSHSSQSGSNQAVLQRITSEWSESVVTWNTLPSVTTVNQVTLNTSSGPLQDYLNIDVTAILQDMIDDPQNSHGFLFRLSTETAFRKMIFASSDNPNSALHPKLVIEYEE